MTDPPHRTRVFLVLAIVASAFAAGSLSGTGHKDRMVTILADNGPVAVISPLPDYVSNGTWWYLDASSSEGLIVNYTWNITLNGVTTYLPSEIEIYMFKTLGLYKITLTVVDNQSRSSQAFTAVVSVLDSDQDTLPDWWEMKYFHDLNQTADGDYDHDGYTNLQEYAAGTDPTKPNPPPSLVKALVDNWVTVIIIAAVIFAAILLLMPFFRKRRKQLEKRRIEAALEIEHALDHED
jgi:hypothetical protein